MEEIKNDLVKGKKVSGKWYVRPLSWAGAWKRTEDGQTLLSEGDVLFESDSEDDCNAFMMNYILLKLVESNPSLPIVPMTYYEVCGGDTGYWLGHIESIEIKEYAINEWNEDDTVVFKDDKDGEKSLVESILKFKYNNDVSYTRQVEKDVSEMWTKAIIVRINV